MDDYDVVVDALEKRRDKLWEMSNRNMNSEYFTLNIMDDIRFYQIQKLDEAIAAHKNKKEWVGLTDEEIQDAGRYSYCRGGTSEKLYHIMWNSQPSASIGWCREELVAFAQVVEAKYREKNQ